MIEIHYYWWEALFAVYARAAFKAIDKVLESVSCCEGVVEVFLLIGFVMRFVVELAARFASIPSSGSLFVKRGETQRHFTLAANLGFHASKITAVWKRPTGIEPV